MHFIYLPYLFTYLFIHGTETVNFRQITLHIPEFLFNCLLSTTFYLLGASYGCLKRHLATCCIETICTPFSYFSNI